MQTMPLGYRQWLPVIFSFATTYTAVLAKIGKSINANTKILTLLETVGLKCIIVYINLS